MAKIVMREIYERSYGIHDHSNARLSPLHLVRMHTKENVSEFSPMYNKIRRFIRMDVGSHVKMSMVDFFNMPTEYVELVFREIAEINAKKLSDTELPP